VFSKDWILTQKLANHLGSTIPLIGERLLIVYEEIPTLS
jgi:hypothetical protein